MSRETKTAHMPVQKREARYGQAGAGLRVPKHGAQPNLDLTIAWNFSRMDKGGKFKCTLALLNEFSSELIKLEGKTVDELMSKKHNHPMSAGKLSSEAKARMEILNLDEETLFQLDLKTPARLWGILEHNIFHIIWLDPEHGVYTGS